MTPRAICRMSNAAVLVALVFLLMANHADAGSPPQVSKGRDQIQPVVQQLSPEVKLIKYANGARVEQLRGNAALAHLQNLIARHPDAFAASRADMLARGFRPTNTVFVERSFHEVSNDAQTPMHPYALAQTSSEQNSDGEIAFWSYDGPGDSWQGTIYMEVYADGAASTWDGQIDTSSEDYPYNWTVQTWGFQGDDGPQNRTAQPRPPLPGALNRAAAIQFAAWKPGQSVFPVAVSWYNWSVCWRAAVVSGCGTAAVGCIRVGAAWPACFATWCIGAELGGGLGCAFQNWH